MTLKTIFGRQKIRKFMSIISEYLFCWLKVLEIKKDIFFKFCYCPFFIGHTTDIAAVLANFNNCCGRGGVGVGFGTHRVILKTLKIIPTTSTSIIVRRIPYPINRCNLLPCTVRAFRQRSYKQRVGCLLIVTLCSSGTDLHGLKPITYLF